MKTRIETFQGFIIQQNEDGYFWVNGGDGGGYYSAIEECRECIAAYNVTDSLSNPAMFEVKWDSPALDDPWWAAP